MIKKISINKRGNEEDFDKDNDLTEEEEEVEEDEMDEENEEGYQEEDECDDKDVVSTQDTPLTKEKSWINRDGELAVDVYETEDDIVIMAPVGGAKKDELEIITEKDMIIIKGQRERPEKKEIKGFYTQECFFGSFRREIILPEETDPSRIDADLKDGVLIIKSPKIEREKRRKIDI